MTEEIKKGKGRPPSWKDLDLWSIRVPKKTTSTIRAVAHAIDDGIVTEAQVMAWIDERRSRLNIKQQEANHGNQEGIQ